MIKKIHLPSFLKPYSSDKLIRFGRNNDGGYLIEKKSMLESDVLLSFGIDHDWSFEEEFYFRTNSLVHTYDGSVGPIFFIKKLKMRIQGLVTKPSKEYFEVSKFWFRLPLNFYKFFKILHSKKGPNHFEKFVGNDEGYIAFKDTLKNIPKKSNKIFLKIDIEGDEYYLLDEIIEKSELFTALVIEFHTVNKNINKIENFISLFDLNLVHTHINNYGNISENGIPEVIELTFSKFSNLDFIENDLPHKLDQSNDKRSWSYEIEFLK
ncbi:hypothetical protein OAI72_00285 [bacterium]|nr:hypothetical protein [bacterium]